MICKKFKETPTWLWCPTPAFLVWFLLLKKLRNSHLALVSNPNIPSLVFTPEKIKKLPPGSGVQPQHS